MNNKEKIFEFVQRNSPDGGFLQSSYWRKFQRNTGKKTYSIENEDFSANLIEHQLPIVGKYFYCPRGPVTPTAVGEFPISNGQIKCGMQEMISLAKKESAGWIRIEPATSELLNLIKENTKEKIVRAPHDMQPKEIFAMDISKSEEQLMAEMKSKTRYNINLAKKKGVKIFCIDKTCHPELVSGSEAGEMLKQVQHDNSYYVEAFLKLTKEMAVRQGIATHTEQYYRKMIESFPADMLKIYVAEYEGEIIAANLVLFFGETATYLHGASGNSHRNVMAPFLLQWQAILDAKQKGCKFYDFGGVETPGVKHQKHSDLVGVTNFKLGFSTVTQTIEFPGSYDIIVNPRAYAIYRGLQKARYLFSKIRK